MRVVVDHDLCSGHGRCASLAPNVFELDEHGYNRMAPFTVAAGLEPDAQRGAAACPERAITIVEDGE